MEFHNWIVSPEGGNVPTDKVKLILSSDHPLKTSREGAFDDAKPALKEVVKAFRDLRDISKKNSKDLKGPRVGRRLYVFMSGHGITPSAFTGSKLRGEAALLLAN